MIPVPHAGGPGFVADIDGVALAVDTDGDGKTEEKVKGAGGTVTLKGKNAEGKAFVYTVRIAPGDGGWVMTPAMTMAGKVAGVDVKLVDMNCDGVFNEIGVDAMMTGAGAASYVSEVASLAGKLFDVSIAAGGTTVTAKPHDGKAGTLNLAKAWKSDGADLVSAIVVSADGKKSFQLAGAKNGLLVPEGEYRLAAGFAKKGSESVKVRGGEGMKPLTVEADKATTLSWGGPVEVDFTFSITKDVLTVPTNLKYLGAAGEEYFEFKPDTKSPLIIVTDTESKAVVKEGRFGGC
ncbi:MAG TPA: hypothetical protein VEI02_05795, partial [Planctomycetota bacterium]|nr:hypothetical protein [Planctomycetota bacterium]